MTINEWSKEAHQLAKEKGWYDKPRSDVEALSLIADEVHEAIDELNKGLPFTYYHGVSPKGELIELADVALRLLDYCGYKGYDLEAAMRLKHDYNTTRPYRHGKP